MTEPGETAGNARRDRHGRGLRGPLLPAGVPSARSRSEQFDDVVLEAAERMARRAPDLLRDVEVAVEDVPAVRGERSNDGTAVPLAVASVQGRRVRVVVYRRPLEVRARDREDLADLVVDVLVDEIADALHVDPASIDPDEPAPGGD
jgi:predicted Zn-dependent protease with MMP-like domain